MASPLTEITPVTLSTGLTTYWTVAGNNGCQTLYVVLCNNSANSCNVTIHFVPAGGSNNSSTIIWADAVSGKRTIPLDFTIARAKNSTVQASASANSAVAMALSSLEVA